MSALNPFTPMQRLNRMLAEDKSDITQVYIYALLNGMVNLSLPLGIQAIINLIQGGDVSAAWIMLVAFVLIGIAITGVFQLMQLRIVENIAQRIFSRASFEFAYRIPKIQFKELYNFYAPELANRFFDTLTIQKGLPKILIDFSLASFQIIAGLIVLSLYHPFFVIFGVILVALVYIILAVAGPRGIKTSLEESKYKYSVAHWLEEVARTKISFKLISDPDIALYETDKRVTRYLNSRESHFKVLLAQFTSLIGFKVFVAAGLLVIGSLLVFDQEMNIGQFVAAEIIIILIINSVEKLIRSLDSVYDVLTALEKIGYVTDMDLDASTGLKLMDNPDKITISANHISYSYPNSNRDIINNVSFNFACEESLLIKGSAGSGKSTLVGLISGILQPTEGVITFNGISMHSLDHDNLRSHIGYSINSNHIFVGSLYDNIAMGRKNVTLEQVSKAIALTRLSNFIAELENGLQTMLDPEGKKIPRSVVNKILLARSIVSEPRLLILEDPLDHVPQDEKELIIEKLVASSNPWSIIVSAIDPLWEKYIPKTIELAQGKIIKSN